MEKNNTNSNNIIELKNITKIFDDSFAAVEEFNLEVKRGEFVTFLGPSGCGKTTTLRMIAGFEIPTSGEILLNGKDISQMPPNKRPINTVFQRYALFPHLNIFDNIAFGLKLKKLPKADIVKKVKKVLEMVDLEGFEDRKVQTLSGGQQQRIAIARALVNEPEILLLDEPLGALDLKMRKEMQLELKNMHERLGITFIYVTHDQEEALTMSDKIVVMSEGKIQQIGTPEDIYNEPKNAFVADFIGESNIFNGIMTGKMKVRFCGAEFECLDDVEHGMKIDAVVRPEDVIITIPEQGAIKGEVISVVFKGVHYEITVVSGKNEIVIQSTKAAKVGDMVGLLIEPDGIHIMISETAQNNIETGVDKNYKLEILEGALNCDLTSIIPNSKFNEDEVLVDMHGDEIDTGKLKVIVSILPEDIEMSDDEDAGIVCGHIMNLIYKGDHYSYVVRTDEEEDFIVDDEDLWNMDDRVSLIIPEDKIKYSLKK
ncbi:MAG: polyamine ABC transporter ATP-binding protein [Coprococcus sp.]|nr:polyamine ABC transporter ATP-binding protein [Coprococcus sp.]